MRDGPAWPCLHVANMPYGAWAHATSWGTWPEDAHIRHRPSHVFRHRTSERRERFSENPIGSSMNVLGVMLGADAAFPFGFRIVICLSV